MSLLVIVVAALIALGAVLYVVHRLRPEVFKIDVGLTRWAWFKIEMRSPRTADPDRTEAPTTSRVRVSGRARR
jgi:hypothetical protein